MVGAILIDLEKAFDTVWYDGLIYQLENKNFLARLIHIIKNMINGKKFVTADGKGPSLITSNIQAGLQQGTIN